VDFVYRGVGEGNANIGVLGIVFVGVGGSCWGELDTCIVGEFDDFACTTGKGFNTDKVATARFCPLENAKVAELFLKGLYDGVFFGTKDVGVFFHVGENTFPIFEEEGMSELVEFVVANGLNTVVFFEGFEVLFSCGNTGNTTTCKGNLGGG